MNSADEVVSPLDHSKMLARSRSRYKSARPSKTIINHQLPPRIPKAPSQRETQRTGDNEKQTRDAQYIRDPTLTAGESRRERGNADKGMNLSAKVVAVEAPASSMTKFRADDALHSDRTNLPLVQAEAVKEARDRLGAERRAHRSSQRPVPRTLDQHFNLPKTNGSIPTPGFSGLQSDEKLAQQSSVPVANPGATRPGQGVSQSVPPKSSILQKRRPAASREELKRAISAPVPIEQSEAFTKLVRSKPAFDAPVSAVNAGERRVMVKYSDIKTSLPVIPTTTSVEIIQAASIQLSQPIDERSVILESFKPLGLERPLRKYERIRDILNSWDNDQQNTLAIVPSATGERDEQLELRSTPKSQPGDTSVFLYHSQKPGSWDKRWVTLRSDGQMMVMKKDGKETFNICHLSDFDIYSPMSRQLRKVKPPKKHCFAIKSQQKSAMFLTTENFVHFFSTSDKRLATSWYKAIQEWRSWYMVNVLGLGQPPETKPSSTPMKPQYQPSSSSVEQAQIPNPLLQTMDIQDATPLRRLPTRTRGPPPLSYPKRLSKDPSTDFPVPHDPMPTILQAESNEQIESRTFAETGLLGRTYTQRRQAQQNKEVGNVRDIPTAATMDLVSAAEGHYVQHNGGCLHRQSSQRTKPNPLLKLYSPQAAPTSSLQHTRSVRRPPIIGTNTNVNPSKMTATNGSPRGLVSAATNATPETFDPMIGSSTFTKRSGTVKRVGMTSAEVGVLPTAISLPHHGNDNEAFTGGLLASRGLAPNSAVESASKQTALTVSGSKSGGETLLGDLGLQTHYAPGSLLDKARQESLDHGDGGCGASEPGRPVLDREKRVEVEIGVGEGVR